MCIDPSFVSKCFLSGKIISKRSVSLCYQGSFNEFLVAHYHEEIKCTTDIISAFIKTNSFDWFLQIHNSL